MKFKSRLSVASRNGYHASSLRHMENEGVLLPFDHVRDSGDEDLQEAYLLRVRLARAGRDAGMSPQEITRALRHEGLVEVRDAIRSMESSLKEWISQGREWRARSEEHERRMASDPAYRLAYKTVTARAEQERRLRAADE